MAAGDESTPPTFSILIAAYQASAFIATAVRSALDQAPPPFEVIVGDDGSTDDLAGALAPFGAAVKLVRIEHGGEGAAKNAAAAAARGEFVAFLDADDEFLPGRLAAMGAFALERPELDVITTDAYLMHEGEVLGRCYGPGQSFREDQRTAILEQNFVLGLSAVRRSRFAEIGGFDTSIAYTVDWDLWMRLILGGSRAGLIAEPLAVYRLHPGSLSARRVAMSRGRLTSIERAEARTDLTAAERRTLVETRRAEEARLARERLRESLLGEGLSGVRADAVRVVLGPHQPAKSRAKASAAFLAPLAVARRLRRQEEGTFVSVGDRRLPLRSS
jgi:hypothetical protein